MTKPPEGFGFKGTGTVRLVSNAGPANPLANVAQAGGGQSSHARGVRPEPHGGKNGHHGHRMAECPEPHGGKNGNRIAKSSPCPRAG